MSDYDPTADPRFLPGDIAFVDPEAIAQEVADLEEQIRLYDQILLVFQQPGWDLISQLHAATRDQLETALVREQDQPTWKFYRGQKTQVDALLAMPADIAIKQRRLRQKMGSLTQILEGER